MGPLEVVELAIVLAPIVLLYLILRAIKRK
jgi:hypothetical protein